MVVCELYSEKPSANLSNLPDLFRPHIGNIPIGGCFKLSDEYRCKITHYNAFNIDVTPILAK